MKKAKGHSKRAFSIMLSVEEAADISPLVGGEIQRLKRTLNEEALDDQHGEQVARRLFRLACVSHRISRALAQKRDAELGREPDFVNSLLAAIDNSQGNNRTANEESHK